MGPPTAIPTKWDNQLCIRHKENDHVYIKTGNYYKKTFSNKHYHICQDCIVSRNPNFQSKNLVVGVDITADLQGFLKERLL